MRTIKTLIGAVMALALLATPTRAAEIGNARLDILGQSLEVVIDTPIATAIDIPAIVQTKFGGRMNADAPAAPGLIAIAELTGPGIDTPITVTTQPGHTFVLPALRRAGDYTLQNIRLATDPTGQFVQLATPSSVNVNVSDVLRPSVTVRQLTPDDLRARGIALDTRNYDYYEEVRIADAAGAAPKTYYPVLDESGTGSLQAVLGADGNFVERVLYADSYGDAPRYLQGPIVDRMMLEVKKGNEGQIVGAKVRVHLDEKIVESTLTGFQLMVVRADGTPVAAVALPPTLEDDYTAIWTIPGDAWTALTTLPTATAIEISVTNTVRTKGWGPTPIAPIPAWALQLYGGTATTPTRPVVKREPLDQITAFVATIAPGDTRTYGPMYEMKSLYLAASTTSKSKLLFDFHAYPFREPATGIVFVRARWYEPATGTWLSPDALSYKDSANLYAFAGGDPVNGSDATGEAVATTANGSWYVTNPKVAKSHRLLSIEWIRTNELAAQDIVQLEGGLTEQETQYWMYDHGFKYTHSYDRPVLQEALPQGNGWFMNGVAATSGLPPQNRQQEVVQGAIRIVSSVALVASPYGASGTLTAYTAESPGPVIGGFKAYADAERGMVPEQPASSEPATSVNQDLWAVGSHGDMPEPRPKGYQSHHGVNSVWVDANFDDYVQNDATAILMKNDPYHNLTRGVFNRFRSEIAARQCVSPRNVDWSIIQPGTIWRLAEEQLDAAQTPEPIRVEFWRQFNEYIAAMRAKR
jgi:RHS repeat-associated protein